MGMGIVSVGFQGTDTEGQACTEYIEQVGESLSLGYFHSSLLCSMYSCIILVNFFLSQKHFFCMHGLTLIIMCVAFYSTLYQSH
jgi:hypothetical protein